MGRSAAMPSPLRNLREDNLASLRDHLLRLDPESRRSRFAMPVDDRFLVAYASSIMRPPCFVLGWFDDGVLRGAGELRLLETSIAEASFSVEPAWRGRGVGTMLFRRIADAARERGVRRLYMTCLAENVAMQALARKFAADLVFDAPMLSETGAEQYPDALVKTPEHSESETEFATAIVRVRPRWLPYPRRRA